MAVVAEGPSEEQTCRGASQWDRRAAGWRTSLSYEVHNRVPRTIYEFEFATLVKTQTQIVTNTRDEIRDCRKETCYALAMRVIMSGSLFNYILLS